jgi:hypothetical protein
MLLHVGRCVHIVNNCVQAMRDAFPIEAEALMAKIYKCFHIRADSDSVVLRFCGEADTEFKTVPQHDKSRVTSDDRKGYRNVRVFESPFHYTVRMLNAYFSFLSGLQ